MALLAFIPSWLRTLLVCAAVGAASFGAGHWHGAQTASAQAEARGAQATIKSLKQRGLINEAVRTVPDCDLARELNPGVVCDEQP